ncbi:MAG: molecular chaperone HtpG, partial [Clostridia bacterium]|nr:molecular chaperone HtpG [Clostridia bacterium]
TELETLNSMIPIWKRAQSEVTEEEYTNFYRDKFFDFESPARVITQNSEGTVTYTALLFIPAHAPFNYYTKDFEKGLELYSSGVMIMEKCAALLPDYFSFVKGLVDSSDLMLNISRETLQHDRQLKVMAKALEKKIKGELSKMMETEREKYEKFFDTFGIQLKYSLYSDYGMHKDTLVDLLLFHSSNEYKYVSLKEYVDKMPEGQNVIYYACGENRERIDILPRVESVKAKGYEILYLTDDVDEFALKMLGKYSDKEFKNVSSEAIDITADEEKTALKEKNESLEDMLSFIKDCIPEVNEVRFTAALKTHSVALTSEGELSFEMEKTLKKMPGASIDAPKASIVLEINHSHPIADKLKELYDSDKDELKNYSRILYLTASLISGVALENPSELSSLVTDLMIK